MSDTATHIIQRMDLRRRRAEALLYQILHIVDPYICDHDEEPLRRRCAEKLYELFYEHGAEIITDSMRAECGLPPRGRDGWTVDEIIAIERARLERLSAPLTMIWPPPGPLK